jgi:steroid delta-isomerase-like uncharacterized protein
MLMAEFDVNRAKARMATVEEHIRSENRHDLEAVMATFGPDARYDDEPWQDHRMGLEKVRSYYTELLGSLPDLSIEVRQRYVASAAIIVEVTIRGTHLGMWRGGMPATGRRVEFPLCGVYTFDAQDRLAGERIYYDRMTVLRQLGLYHDPAERFGRIMTILTHPITIAADAPTLSTPFSFVNPSFPGGELLAHHCARITPGPAPRRPWPYRQPA